MLHPKSHSRSTSAPDHFRSTWQVSDYFTDSSQVLRNLQSCLEMWLRRRIVELRLALSYQPSPVFIGFIKLRCLAPNYSLHAVDSDFSTAVWDMHACTPPSSDALGEGRWTSCARSCINRQLAPSDVGKLLACSIKFRLRGEVAHCLSSTTSYLSGRDWSVVDANR